MRKRDPKPTIRRRVSPPRLMIVLLLTTATIGLSGLWATRTVLSAFTPTSGVRFSPYVDVTLTPVMHFEDPMENRASEVVLSFIVADTADGCTPSWGTYYSLDAAARALDLDRRIARLRERDGDIAVSFGGAINDELARTCLEVDRLADAYSSVVARYDATTLDFDIEGAAIADTAANERRGAAVAKLQAESDTPIAVWLTLPVAPTGLTPEAEALVTSMLDAGVDLAGVNVMTMNYGGSRTDGQTMAEASEAALVATQAQVAAAYALAGEPLTPADSWAKVGATPMIGQNDVASETFSLDDAQRLTAFAEVNGLGRLSMWSVNRDGPCGVQLEGPQVSNTCSGVDQKPGEFSQIFAANLPRTSAVRPSTPVTEASAESRDDPASSPYPIWRENKPYETGAKVVWHRNVYEAKWWNQDTLPDAPVDNVWDTPWRYLGPVLPGDGAALRTVANEGLQPRWSGETVYVAGDEVIHDGTVFRARWWTQGDEPQESPDRAFDHPWEFVGEAPEEDIDDAGNDDADDKDADSAARVANPSR